MSHWEHSSPLARPRIPAPAIGQPARRPGPGLAGPPGRGRMGGGGEACEQSVISGCSRQGRKRELGIAAPSPFTYFLSSRVPALAPARGRGRGRRRQPPGSARPSPQGEAGLQAPDSGSARPSQPPAVPLGTDSKAQPRSRPWRRPGLGHSGTRSSPGAPAPCPPPASASAAGGGAGSPRKPSPRPQPAEAPGDPTEPSVLPSHASRGTSDHPVSPSRRGDLSPAPSNSPHPPCVSTGSQTCSPKGLGSRRAAPRPAAPA